MRIEEALRRLPVSPGRDPRGHPGPVDGGHPGGRGGGEASEAGFLSFIEPLRGEFRSRQGAYREFLRETLPQTIRAEVARPAPVAAGRSTPTWPSSGTSTGRRSRRPSARGGLSSAGWQADRPAEGLRPEVRGARRRRLGQVRPQGTPAPDQGVRRRLRPARRTRSSTGRGPRGQGPTRLVEAQHDAIKADAKALETVGKVMVDQLREEVNARLVKKLEAPIRRRCKRFVDANEHVGTGVKGPDSRALRRLGRRSHRDGGRARRGDPVEMLPGGRGDDPGRFQRHLDPLDAARDAIIDAHENTSEERRPARKQVLAEIESVLANAPQLPPDDGHRRPREPTQERSR